MRFDNVQFTDIVQLPAVKKGNKVLAFPPEILKLDEQQLRNMAIVMGGALVFIKLRAVYTPLQDSETMCVNKDCWRPAHDDMYCEDHNK